MFGSGPPRDSVELELQGLSDSVSNSDSWQLRPLQGLPAGTRRPLYRYRARNNSDSEPGGPGAATVPGVTITVQSEVSSGYWPQDPSPRT